MNQIRTDKTKLTREQKADWELRALADDAMSQRDLDTQDAIVQGWTDIWNSGDTAKIKEMELARRIGAVAEEDTLEKRVQESIKEFKAGQIITGKLQDLQNSGQTEEEFREDEENFGRKYRSIVKQARQEAGLNG